MANFTSETASNNYNSTAVPTWIANACVYAQKRVHPLILISDLFFFF